MSLTIELFNSSLTADMLKQFLRIILLKGNSDGRNI
jgi:hypothetical protein